MQVDVVTYLLLLLIATCTSHCQIVSKLDSLPMMSVPDAEASSGSHKDNCGVFSNAVTWTDRGVICDDCSIWFHATCVNMCDAVYQNEQSNVS